MPVYLHNPHIGRFTAGSDFRIWFAAKDKRTDQARDWTGATAVTVTLTPEIGDAVSLTGSLSSTPGAYPQAYVDVADTSTSSLTVPQRISGVVAVTLASGFIDREKFQFDLR